MILGFKTTYKGKPTQFPEKILAGIKIHSLREDPSDRWKAGIRIDMATGVRTKHYHCFHQTPCTGTQAVELGLHGLLTAAVEGRVLLYDQLLLLAKNDGFERVDDFFGWFEPMIIRSWKKHRRLLRRKIIHWTEFRY